MTGDVITVKPGSTVEELARLLIEHKISGVPVVDDADHIVGIVTENDLINKNKRLHIPTIVRLFDAYFLLDSKKVEDDIKKLILERGLTDYIEVYWQSLEEIITSTE